MMQKIDAEHLDHPAKGVVGMTDFLLEEGYKVGLRKVRRMMRLMGIMPVCHRKHLSKLGSASYIKPYLLRGLDIDHRNQVWCIDITYIQMKKGLMYLTAIATYGAPEIINSDQGCQFTCKAWLDACAQHPQMRVSMDGRDRAKDNILIERFWKTIKYEYICVFPEENGAALYTGIKRFIDNYNYHRRHQGIDRQVPSKLYIRPAA